MPFPPPPVVPCPNFWIYLLQNLYGFAGWLLKDSEVHISGTSLFTPVHMIIDWFFNTRILTLEEVWVPFFCTMIMAGWEVKHILYAAWRWYKRIVEG
jgi:hypothetical protein